MLILFQRKQKKKKEKARRPTIIIGAVSKNCLNEVKKEIFLGYPKEKEVAGKLTNEKDQVYSKK